MIRDISFIYDDYKTKKIYRYGKKKTEILGRGDILFDDETGELIMNGPNGCVAFTSNIYIDGLGGIYIEDMRKQYLLIDIDNDTVIKYQDIKKIVLRNEGKEVKKIKYQNYEYYIDKSGTKLMFNREKNKEDDLFISCSHNECGFGLLNSFEEIVDHRKVDVDFESYDLIAHMLRRNIERPEWFNKKMKKIIMEAHKGVDDVTRVLGIMKYNYFFKWVDLKELVIYGDKTNIEIAWGKINKYFPKTYCPDIEQTREKVVYRVDKRGEIKSSRHIREVIIIGINIYLIEE